MTEKDEFECSYCGESFETRQKRDECRAKHFEGTESIPVRTVNRNQDKNILDDYAEEVSN